MKERLRLSDSASNRTAVAVVGNLNLDVRTGVVHASPAILADGETSVTEIHESVGGGGANTATAIASMGGEAHLYCTIGDDPLGTDLVSFLEGLGVRTHAVAKPVATGRSVALSWDTHQRHFVSSLPNTRLLEHSDIDLDALLRTGCRHLYRADVWFAERMLEEGNTRLLRRAREAGIETSLDINWDPAWSARDGSVDVSQRIGWLKKALPFVSYVHGNERELRAFAGDASLRRSVRLLRDWGARAVIVHRGAQGCAAATAEGWIEVPAVPVNHIVNEVGTGDVFTAAFLLGGHLPITERLAASAGAAARHLQGIEDYIPRLTR